MRASTILILAKALMALASPIDTDTALQERDDTPDMQVREIQEIQAVNPPADGTDAEGEEPTLVERSPSAQTISILPSAQYTNVILNNHNIHRHNHSAGNVVWDSTLAKWAGNSASKCVFKHDMNQGSGGYGQNLAVWGSTGNIGKMKNAAAAMGITNQWYNDELPHWHYWGAANPPNYNNLDSWGHFTQVVWKNTKRVGCATVMCKSGTIFSMPSWYTVCNYSPAGNYGGQYGANVAKPLGNRELVIKNA